MADALRSIYSTTGLNRRTFRSLSRSKGSLDVQVLRPVIDASVRRDLAQDALHAPHGERPIPRAENYLVAVLAVLLKRQAIP